MAFRYNFTTEGIPSFWRQALWYTDLFVVRPILRYSSDYWYSNMTGYQNLTRWNFNATTNGTTYLQYLLTSNDTVSYKIVSPTEVWVWEKIKIDSFANSFPKGSKHIPVVTKLAWGGDTGKMLQILWKYLFDVYRMVVILEDRLVTSVTSICTRSGRDIISNILYFAFSLVPSAKLNLHYL